MKEPVHIYCDEPTMDDEQEEDYILNGFPLRSEILDFALKRDKKDHFVSFMNDTDNKDTEYGELDLIDWVAQTPCWAVDKMFSYDAVNCATAVLNGETTDINFTNDAVPCKDGILLPGLHKAALFRAPKITQLFLENGANPNLRIDVNHMRSVLPLHVILESMRSDYSMSEWILLEAENSNSYWCEESSLWTADPIPRGLDFVFKLLYYLNYPYLRMALENLRLLAKKTNKIDQEFFNYVKERRVFEVAALLMVACEDVMPGPEGRKKIHDFLLTEIASLTVVSLRSVHHIEDAGFAQQCEAKKMEFEAILLVFKIFERIGDKLTGYLQMARNVLSTQDVAKELAWIFVEAGIDLKFRLLDETRRRPFEFDRYSTFIDKKCIQRTCNSYQSMSKRFSAGNTIGFHKLSSTGEICNHHAVVPLSHCFQGSSRKLFHTLHSVRPSQHFGSATQVNKVFSGVLHFHLKKLCVARACQDFHSASQVNEVCNGVPHLQSRLQSLVGTMHDLPSTTRLIEACGRVSNMQYWKNCACYVATLKRGLRCI